MEFEFKRVKKNRVIVYISMSVFFTQELKCAFPPYVPVVLFAEREKNILDGPCPKMTALMEFFPEKAARVVGRLSRDLFNPGVDPQEGTLYLLPVSQEEMEDVNSISAQVLESRGYRYPITQDSTVQSVQREIEREMSIPIASQVFAVREWLFNGEVIQKPFNPMDLHRSVTQTDLYNVVQWKKEQKPESDDESGL